MAALSDPLTLPCGLVLPDRLMKAALSEGMANKRHAPDKRLERLYSTWGKGGLRLDHHGQRDGRRDPTRRARQRGDRG